MKRLFILSVVALVTVLAAGSLNGSVEQAEHGRTLGGVVKY
jgi:hypothetical protein